MPNGTEVVAGVPGSGGRRFFYHPLVWQGSAWIISMPVAYEIIPDGSIVTGRGVGTGWSAGQVLDTGRTTGKP
ncbi:MAG: hypothetical protein H7Z38_04440 [Rubrivivax sp.]|nr:hypothetical protein [Pyrinomonadaceae bacterium]